jgi:hypothetical protein
VREIYDALYDISQEISYDPITRHEAELLANHMKIFKFLCNTVIWYNILKKVNIASKVLQKKEVDLSAAVEILTNTLEYLKKYRSDDGFSSALIDAKEIASDLDVELTFCKENSIRSRRKINSSIILILMNLCRILTPNSKLSFSIAFWMQYYNQWRSGSCSYSNTTYTSNSYTT